MPNDQGKIVDSIKVVESIYINLYETDDNKHVTENKNEKLFFNKINAANHGAKENQPSELSSAVAINIIIPVKM